MLSNQWSKSCELGPNCLGTYLARYVLLLTKSPAPSKYHIPYTIYQVPYITIYHIQVIPTFEGLKGLVQADSLNSCLTIPEGPFRLPIWN